MGNKDGLLQGLIRRALRLPPRWVFWLQRPHKVSRPTCLRFTGTLHRITIGSLVRHSVRPVTGGDLVDAHVLNVRMYVSVVVVV